MNRARFICPSFKKAELNAHGGKSQWHVTLLELFWERASAPMNVRQSALLWMVTAFCVALALAVGVVAVFGANSEGFRVALRGNRSTQSLSLLASLCRRRSDLAVRESIRALEQTIRAISAWRSRQRLASTLDLLVASARPEMRLMRKRSSSLVRQLHSSTFSPFFRFLVSGGRCLIDFGRCFERWR